MSSLFFDELCELFEYVGTYQIPTFVVGDINVRLDRPDNVYSVQLQSVVDSFGFCLHSTGQTHRRGGTLDVVLSRSDDTALFTSPVSVIDVGISDHHFLKWAVRSSRQPAAEAVAALRRSWGKLNVDEFRSALHSSRLCHLEQWPVDVDVMATLYSTKLTCILDRLIPARSVVRKPRPSDPRFDAECRAAKRVTRRLERAYAAADRRAVAHRERSGSTGDNISVVAAAAAAKATWYAQRRAYHQLRATKRNEFWSKQVTSASSSRQLWTTVNQLLGRGKPAPSNDIDVDTFSQFFTNKVESVRANTSSSQPPIFSTVRDDITLSTFAPVSAADVTQLIRQLPDKSSDADLLPVQWLKNVVDEIAPFLTELINRSLASGQFPAIFKLALITPIVKKTGLDATEPKSYRPISNLPVVSKLLERVVARQLVQYVTAAGLLPTLQSGFRSFHSTETAVLKVLSDIYHAVDQGDIVALLLLDLSAAFDTVDHPILIKRLEHSFGISDAALSWFRSYLSDRKEIVRRGTLKSAVHSVTCGVPQGSVLGPILFVLYTADLAAIIQRHQLCPHHYADDTQIYGSCRPSAAAALVARMSSCVEEVADWMRSNRLQLNAEKSEFIWFGTRQRIGAATLPSLPVLGDVIAPSSIVRNLGIYMDSQLSMGAHVDRTVARCFATLRQLRSVRRSVSTSVFQTLVTSLVVSRLDYGNAVLCGLPNTQLRRVQSVLNAGARLIFGLRRSDHISSALVSLHWLRARERTVFKMAVLVYRSLNCQAPIYLSSSLMRVSDIPSRRRLRSSSTMQLDVPRHRISVGARAFPVAGATIWNSLPDDVTSAPSISTFRRRLKTFLFSRSHPDITL